MKDKWSELSGELDEATTDRLDEALPRYAVPPPAPSARKKAVDAALRLLERKAAHSSGSLWEQMKVEARFLPPWYYLASILIAAAGVFLLLANATDASRIGLLAGIVPLPALLGLLEVFHGADEGMAEIECACRYSPARVLSARMLIIGAVSCAVCALLGACSGFGSAWMAAGLVVVPFCLSAALGLFLSAMLQGRASSAQVALAVAFINGAAAMTAQMKAAWLEAATPACWAALMALSLAALSFSLREMLASGGKLYERKLLRWN